MQCRNRSGIPLLLGTVNRILYFHEVCGGRRDAGRSELLREESDRPDLPDSRIAGDGVGGGGAVFVGCGGCSFKEVIA